jgi:hypothetical protein
MVPNLATPNASEAYAAVIEATEFHENPTKSIPISNAIIPKGGMLRKGIPIDSNTNTNPRQRI